MFAVGGSESFLALSFLYASAVTVVGMMHILYFCSLEIEELSRITNDMLLVKAEISEAQLCQSSPNSTQV